MPSISCFHNLSKVTNSLTRLYINR